MSQASYCDMRQRPGRRSGLCRRAVFVVGDVLAPFGLGLARIWCGALPHRQVAHETIGRGAVPMPFTRRRVHGVAGAHDDELTAAGLDQPDAVGDVQRLSDGMGVPCGSCAWCETHSIDPYARGLLTSSNDVEIDVAGEHF